MPHEKLAHRVHVKHDDQLDDGRVSYAPIKSLWLCVMLFGTLLAICVFPSVEGVILYALSTAFILLFGHSLGSHRKFIHDSFQCPKWLEYSLVYCGTLVGIAGPLGLLKQHELRDYAQRLSTCHPYLRHGAGVWRDAWWQLHCDLRFTQQPLVDIEASRSTRFYRFLETTWMSQQLPIALVLYMVGGWGFVCWGVCARVATGVIGHWLIGYFAHNHGDLRYEVRGAAVQGRNIAWTSLLTMGESWHNNHHAFPGSAKLGLQRGEWDPGWWVLATLHRLGLVWDIVLPHDLPPRPELAIRLSNPPPIPREPQSALMKEAP
jgi:sn-2 palmitoyl-lipid 9-desaturase